MKKTIFKNKNFVLPASVIILALALFGFEYLGAKAAENSWLSKGSNLYYTAGRIGIGTNSPGATLDIGGNLRITNAVNPIFASPSGFFDLRPNSAKYGIILRQSGDTSDWGNIKVEETYLGLSKNSTSFQLIIKDGGNIGIGTVDPTEKLQVEGNIKLKGNIISDGDICIGKCN